MCFIATTKRKLPNRLNWAMSFLAWHYYRFLNLRRLALLLGRPKCRTTKKVNKWMSEFDGNSQKVTIFSVP